MESKKEHKDGNNKANFIGSIIILAAVTAGLIYFWSYIFGEVTVRELSEESEAYWGRTIRVRGTVVSLRYFDFGIGKVDNFIMRLEDEGASIELMYDRLSQRYKPKVGDRVRIVGHFWSYGEMTHQMLIANKIKLLGNGRIE